MDHSVPEHARSAVDEEMRLFRVVLVPFDRDLDIAEESVLQSKDRALSAMLDHAKERFAKLKLQGGKYVEYQEQIRKEHAGIKQQALDQLANMTLCEVIPVVPSCKETFNVAINMVVDDKGTSKDAPINERATAICSRCGLEQLCVRGDAFFCKQFDNDEGFYRIDFTLADLQGEHAYWIELAKGLRMKDKALLVKCAKQLKEMGNTHVKASAFDSAIGYYRQGARVLGECSDAGELKAQILSNQSMCHLKQGCAELALQCADESIRSKPGWNKAWGRRGEALMALNRDQEAQVAFEKAGLSRG